MPDGQPLRLFLPPMSWVAELRERKVFRVAAAYAVVAWLLVQVASVVLPALNLPPWTVTFTTVLLILGFPVALLLAWSFDIVRDRGQPAAAVASPGTVLVARSVLVLPFVNMSEDAAQTHCADGIVEDLTTRLQALVGIKVRSRQSAFAYQGRSVDARTISRELGCQYVVEGSVRKVDDRIRVTAQLIDAVRDEHVWAERYDRKLEDAFALQDEICDRIVAAIESRIAPTGTPDAAADAGAGTTAAPSTVVAPSRTPSRRVSSLREVITSPWVLPGVLVLITLAGALTWTLQQRSRERWAREEALPELEALIAADDYQAAFDLAARIEPVIPNDPRLKALEPSFAEQVKLRSEPAGAQVYYRPYSAQGTEWRLIGRTPLEGVSIPMGVGLWKLEHPQRNTAVFAIRNPSMQLENDRDPFVRAEAEGVDFTLPLAVAATSPREMVLVPATQLPVVLVSPDVPVDLPSFFIDRYEVTNREFKDFVDAGGYDNAAFWSDLPYGEKAQGWQNAVAKFVDSTGQPGPSTWEAGSYHDGTADHPVAGVSWFEAVAYARFRDKQLPSAYHWYRAAYSPNEFLDSLASSIVGASNFSGRGDAAVGRYAGIGPYGTYDMAGNVREWLWTEASTGRWIAGGGWNEPPYLFNQPDSLDPYDRSATNGLRCMRTIDGEPISAALLAPSRQESVDVDALVPVADDVYQVVAQQLGYSSASLAARAEPLESSNPAWRREQVTLATGYDDTRFAVQLFLPSRGTPPYQVVVYAPHAGFFQRRTQSSEFDPTDSSQPLDFIVKSGRVLVVIAYDGTFERYWPPARKKSMSESDRYLALVRHFRQEAGRTLDYLATRDDLDVRHVGWFSESFGSQTMISILAVEKRFSAAVLAGGGVFPLGLPAADEAYNHLPRITQPVLMLNGRWDIDVNLEAQQRQFELLGTSSARKKHVLFEAGHGTLPHHQLVRESLEWFDKYLGPTRPMPDSG